MSPEELALEANRPGIVDEALARDGEYDVAHLPACHIDTNGGRCTCGAQLAAFPYDAVEMGICFQFENGDCERDDVTPEEADAIVADDDNVTNWVWAVYWHRKEGGAEWIADFSRDERENAEHVYNALCAYVRQGGPL